MGLKLIDLSQEIFSGAPVWPGHPKTIVEIVDTHESTRRSGRFTENYGYTSEKICMSTHGTTHVDSISHIDPTPGAPSIEKIPLDWFYTEAVCIDLSHVPQHREPGRPEAISRKAISIYRPSTEDP